MSPLSSSHVCGSGTAATSPGRIATVERATARAGWPISTVSYAQCDGVAVDRQRTPEVTRGRGVQRFCWRSRTQARPARPRESITMELASGTAETLTLSSAMA